MNAPATAPQPGSNAPRAPTSAGQRLAQTAMALCLAAMACAVFVNVVLRYGFGSGLAASEELSRLLFVWMVFIGATAAYPAGEHMAFTSLLLPLRSRPRALRAMSLLIHALVLAAAVMLAWGAWLQVVVGMGSRSPVVGYPAALLPLPALLSSLAIAAMALVQLLRGKLVELEHAHEAE